MLSSLSLYTYDLPLHPSFALKLPTRKGIILESPEHKVFAEAAPLPGFSKESYEDALQELSSMLNPLLSMFSQNLCREQFLSFLQESNFSASVTFAIYSLFEQIHSPMTYPCQVPIRSYIDIPYKTASLSADVFKRLSELGVNDVVKIKLGSYPVTSAIDFIRTIIKSCPARLHLDINQKWSLEEALLFSESFEENSFLAIEDPIDHPLDLWRFAELSPHPIALDHTLRTHSIYDFLTLPHLTSCEFKPTLDMTLILDQTLLPILKTAGIKHTFSSCYETAIGICSIARLGLQLAPGSPLGIDTLGVFSQELINPSLQQRSNHIVLHHPLTPYKHLLSLYDRASLSHC